MSSRPVILMKICMISLILVAISAVSVIPRSMAEAQSGRQQPQKKAEKKTEGQKEPGQGDNKSGEQQPDESLPALPRGTKDEPVIKLSTQVVSVPVTVIDKKTQRILYQLDKKNFTIYEDGIKQVVTNFSRGDGPITVVLLLDNGFQNRYFSNYFDPSIAQEIFRSAAGFIQGFTKPKDFIAIVTFAMKVKVVQDFTGDKGRLMDAINLAYRDTLNFRESNIYDALSFVLLGGKAIQLDQENQGQMDYNGLEELEGHTAVILITTGIDTFSKINFDKALKIVSNAGVPIFTVGVGNLFYKKYEYLWPPETRLTFLQAFNGLGAFAERTGGLYQPMTFEGEIPTIMRNIENLLRTQYILGFVPSNTRRLGKERKIKVEVDVDGDGKPDNDKLEVRFRQRYYEPDDTPKKK